MARGPPPPNPLPLNRRDDFILCSWHLCSWSSFPELPQLLRYIITPLKTKTLPSLPRNPLKLTPCPALTCTAISPLLCLAYNHTPCLWVFLCWPHVFLGLACLSSGICGCGRAYSPLGGAKGRRKSAKMIDGFIEVHPPWPFALLAHQRSAVEEIVTNLVTSSGLTYSLTTLSGQKSRVGWLDFLLRVSHG